MIEYIPSIVLAAALLVVGVWLECQRRKYDGKAGNPKMDAWLAWRAGEPKPGSEKYNDWNEGGGARYLADRERYYRENPEPKL